MLAREFYYPGDNKPISREEILNRLNIEFPDYVPESFYVHYITDSPNNYAKSKEIESKIYFDIENHIWKYFSNGREVKDPSEIEKIMLYTIRKARFFRLLDDEEENGIVLNEQSKNAIADYFEKHNLPVYDLQIDFE